MADLGPESVATRFLHHDEQLRAALRHRDFMPHRSETSVADITGLCAGEVWAMGANTLRPGSGRTQVRGRADLTVGDVMKLGLTAIRDDVPFVRHSVITGWPDGEDADARCKELAKELAAAARLVRR